MIVHILLAAAALMLLWPSGKKPALPALPLPSPGVAPVPAAPKYIEAMTALQVVRHRISETQLLGDEQQTAINVLTLALVAGSEK